MTQLAQARPVGRFRVVLIKVFVGLRKVLKVFRGPFLGILDFPLLWFPANFEYEVYSACIIGRFCWQFQYNLM